MKKKNYSKQVEKKADERSKPGPEAANCTGRRGDAASFVILFFQDINCGSKKPQVPATEPPPRELPYYERWNHDVPAVRVHDFLLLAVCQSPFMAT